MENIKKSAAELIGNTPLMEMTTIKNKETETSDYDFVISKGDIQSLFQLASFIDELEKAFGANIDVITDTSNNIEFLEQIKKDEVVVYESKR